jgi:uncharacterized membrane-anchored protein
MRRGIAALLLAVSPLIYAQEEPQGEGPSAQAFVDSLQFRHGQIDLPEAKARLNLSDSFEFLDAEDAERVLTEYWGNPPGSGAIGMLVPTEYSLADADNAWAIILQYDADGYVSDEDAQEIDYEDLLEDMQADAEDSNEERRRLGYGGVELVGWAEPPRYDVGSHKLHWAKELAFEGETAHTLNYDVRVLGREGVLVMRAVSGIHQLPSIKASMGEAIGAAEFVEGARYADFNPGTDRVAEYGLASLVAGGIAAKTGLLSKLLAVLIAGKKLVIGGLVLLVAGVARQFGKKKAD